MQKLKDYAAEYANFEAILYGATEKNGLTVEGEQIEVELVSNN